MTVEDAKKFGLTDLDAYRLAFASAHSLDDALDIAWGYQRYKERQCRKDGTKSRMYYQHYTTLSSVVTKIHARKWWLTRNTAIKLNDQQEAKKFGDWKLAKRIYQASFVRGTDESAAMWGLYGRNNPFAMKILIPADAMMAWIKQLKKDFGKLGEVEFKDVIYASVPFVQKERDGFDKDRGNSICWSNVRCNFCKRKKEQDKLAQKLLDPKLTGWVKDSEWRHECETRLCVRVARARANDAIPVRIPAEVVEKMSFTFSPWLDRSFEDEVMNVIKCVLPKSGKMSASELIGRFHRSILQGALNLRD